MGESLYLGEASVRLLADLVSTAASSNTRRVLVQHLAEAFSAHLPLAAFEFGWCESARANSATVGVFEPGREVREQTRDLRTGDLADVIREGKPIIIGLTFTIPIPDSEAAPGYARLTLASPSGNHILSAPMLELLARTLGFARHHCRLVERIAKLSSNAHQESQGLREELRKYVEPGNIVARSESMRRAMENVELVALHDTTVLLRGESGTGKEVLARRIHQLSKRARQPFVTVNCGALPETLIESELFGHEKGAFTSAASRYRGRFERANNGTLFLDEIAELPLSAQVKVLRVLQEGEFERLGGEQTIRVNVRVLAATHRPLEAMMDAGTFRTDLFYRINVFPIVIPPLRERTEDLPLLARTILADTAKRLGCRLSSLGPGAVEKLLSRPWPGNVRELANALERALIMSQGRELQIPDLPGQSTAVIADLTKPDETFDDGARRTIQLALDACNGKIYGKLGAAARLGIPPSTLQGKMRRLNLKRRVPEFRKTGY